MAKTKPAFSRVLNVFLSSVLVLGLMPALPSVAYATDAVDAADKEDVYVAEESAPIALGEPAFDPLALFYDDFRLYPTVAAYNAGTEP